MLIAGLGLSLASRACASPWPPVETDLPVHPSLHSGTLPNGVRYLFYPNDQPRERVSLRLLVAVGAAHERDDEVGLAHFIEHMAYRGTRRYPAGSLTAALQRLGVGIGPDSSAFTFYEYTVYHLELPDGTDATLREGLRVFREYAEGITFATEGIETERGVVLSELATRDTPQQRAQFANQRFLWPDSQFAARPIGGTTTSLRSFRREHFQAFYDAWYRPERLAVVVVGPINPPAVASLLAAELGSLASRAPAREEPSAITPERAHRPDVDIFADPGLIGAQISFQHPRRVERTPDSHARRVELLHLGLAFAMFQERLQRLAQAPGASFVTPLAQLSTPFRDWQLATFSVATRIDNWKAAFREVEQEHRRVYLHGFTAGELATARAVVAASSQHTVNTFATWPSDWLASRLAHGVVTGAAFVHPAELQRDLAPAVASATSNDCRDAFRAAWTTAAPHVFVTAHPTFAISPFQIAHALNESRDTEVPPAATHPASQFAYQDFGPPGRLVRVRHEQDLDVRLAEFANGVRFNFKATDFAADSVELHVRVGDGMLSQLESQPGLGLLANYMVMGGGLGRHTQPEFTGVLAGRTIHVAFQTGSDALTFRGAAASRDLLLALQIVAAYLTDTAYRPEVMRDARASFTSMYAAIANAPSGSIPAFAFREMAGGDRRFGTPHADELFSRDLAELRAWIEPQFKQGPIEVSVVGTATWEEASAAVARTLGALPARGSRAEPARDPAFRIPAPSLNVRSILIDPKLKQSGLAWYWPVQPFAGIHEERRLRLLTAVLSNRVHERVRTELGAAYSATATFSAVSGFPNYNMIAVHTEVPPASIARVTSVIERAALELALRGVPEDEFLRARQPFLREREDNLRTNVYWGVTVLADAQEHPERLTAARDRSADSAAISRDELGALSKRLLDPGSSFRYVTIPSTPPPPTPARPAANATPGRQPKVGPAGTRGPR